MVTKGYRKGVYDRVTEGTWEWTPFGNGCSCRSLCDSRAAGWKILKRRGRGETPRRTQRGPWRKALTLERVHARASAVSVKIRIPSRAGRGRRRMTCQTIMIIEWILRAGETANESRNKPQREATSPKVNLWWPHCKQSRGYFARS